MIKRYYIFGLMATVQPTAREVAYKIINGDGDLYIFNPETQGINDLLRFYTGHEDFAEVDKEYWDEIVEEKRRIEYREEHDLDIKLLLSSGFGVYIPQRFVELYPEKVSDEDRRFILESDPNETDGYWDAWNTVLDNTTIEDENKVQYYLHHDEDLWLVPVGYEFEEFTE